MQNRSGVALIVVLFAVALVSIVVLAYFSLAMANRNISFSSAGEARANIVALSALDYVKGDLISEIQYGSTLEVDPNGSKVPVYYPSTNTTMVPYRMTGTLSPADYTLPPNLVKWSSGTIAQWPATAAYGTQPGPIRGSTASTTSPAINGHFLTASLWTKPVFGTNTAFSSAATPQWVYLSRSGPLTPAVANSGNMPALNNANSTNYVIGRYAYTVYDEGGLLDVAAAGYSPDTFSSDPTDVGRKGSQAFADLTQLGLSQGQVDQLVGWRNSTSASNAAAYLGYLTTNAPATGFMTAATNDQAFVSRQDLIAFWMSPKEMNLATTAGTNILNYLTTFSREKNAPSWGPEHDANDANDASSPTYWNGSNTDIPYDSVTYNDPSGGISYAYHTSRDVVGSGTQNNRFFPNVRVKTSFKRLSGDTAVVGEPLVKNRFDLTKLAWITYKGPSGDLPTTDPLYNAAGTDANIYNYFGLTANYSAASGNPLMSWTYNHTFATAPSVSDGTLATDTDHIKTLDEVASLTGNLAREPDFFELLQAGILRGSLGLTSGDPTQATNLGDSASGGEFYRAANPINPGFPLDDGGGLYRPMNKSTSAVLQLVYAQAMDQIMQIGANMIDEDDTDNFPTDIILNGDNFYGVENLPYISGVGDAALRVADTVPPATAAPYAMSYDVTSTTDNTISGKVQFQQYVHRWLDFALWNPHQNASTPPSVGPTDIRVSVVAGKEYPFVVGLGNFNPPTTASPGGGSDYSGRIFELPVPDGSVNTPSIGSPAYADGPAWIGMKLSAYNNFPEPTLINYTNSYTSDANNPATQNINDPDGRIATAPGGNVANGWQRAGIYLGWSKSPDNPYKVPACTGFWPGYTNSVSPSGLPTIAIRSAGVQTTLPLTIYLQYEDIQHPGTWHTYQELRNLYYSRNTGGGDSFMEPNDTSWSSWLRVPAPPNAPTGNSSTVSQLINGAAVPATYTGAMLQSMDTTALGLFDPRSPRFNIWSWHNSLGLGRAGTGSDSMTTNTVHYVNEPSKGMATGPHFQNPANLSDSVWTGAAETWVDNVSVSPRKNYDYVVGGADPTSFYRDRDSIPRLGDAAGWTNVVMPADAPATDPKGASPINTGAQMQRPLHLDRPFRSVAELGYVSRDDPWKTLNFISANSADSALLDIFYIGSTNSTSLNVSPPDVIAGKMNINSAAQNILSSGTTTLSSPVLQALLSQTVRDYDSPVANTSVEDTGLTVASDIKNLSTNIVNYVKVNGPVTSIGDIAGAFPQVTASSPPTPLYTGLKNPSEALVRAVADSSGTRTWNLMIDVVAQSGKFNPNAGNLNNFTVDGEKHYWLHVAIDRFTGEIVDEQLEPVWE
jgi:hypothetical protein